MSELCLSWSRQIEQDIHTLERPLNARLRRIAFANISVSLCDEAVELAVV